ncbi:MAG: ADP-heptose--LPS heptosyltransferase 2 [Chlamydiae bacterium]|nr:ADP-heptose--LPS heptosyltransferase 2 [Chlamydiota bacterium]
MKKVAIVRRNGLGDLLCAFPLVLYFKRYHPHTHITLFVDHKNYPLIRYLPPVDEVVVLPATGNKYFNLLRVALKYRSADFDLVISAKTSPMKLMNFFLFFLGGRKRVAYVDKSWHSRMINQPIAYDETKAKKIHQALKGLHTVAPHLQVIPHELYPRIRISEEIKQRYQKLISVPHPSLLISASTTRESSRFDAERIATIVNRLYDDYSFSVVIIGEKKDRQRAEAIGAKLKTPYRLCFPRNFEEFMVLLDLCDLYFIGDGGIAHIGAALGKRGVALFGQTSPMEWHPLSARLSALYHPVHVNHLSDEMIITHLQTKIEEDGLWKRQFAKSIGS